MTTASKKAQWAETHAKRLTTGPAKTKAAHRVHDLVMDAIGSGIGTERVRGFVEQAIDPRHRAALARIAACTAEELRANSDNDNADDDLSGYAAQWDMTAEMLQ